MKIYLAGKIRKNCWREGIVCVSHLAFCDDGESRAAQPWPIIPGAILNGEHDYVGPYFFSCDHGCYHGQNQHGFGLNSDCGGDELAGGREGVCRNCLQAVRNADLVFCWLDGSGAYGTACELGYAAAFGKPIFWGSSEKRFEADMWFPLGLGEKADGECPSSSLSNAIDAYYDQGLHVLDFGQHCGQQIRWVPDDYLRWFYNTPEDGKNYSEDAARRNRQTKLAIRSYLKERIVKPEKQTKRAKSKKLQS